MDTDDTLNHIIDGLKAALRNNAKTVLTIDFGTLQAVYSLNIDTHPKALARHLEKFAREARKDALEAPK